MIGCHAVKGGEGGVFIVEVIGRERTLQSNFTGVEKGFENRINNPKLKELG